MTSKTMMLKRGRLAVSLGALGAAMLFAGMAQAQTASTSGIRGLAEPGAQVIARNVATGFTSRDTADASGDYSLLGLAPGTYEVTAGGETRTVRVLVGQTATLDLAGDVAATDEVVVTARAPAADVTTSEVATNVTQEQIENLPQINRNFLKFAALAPGVRVSDNEAEVTFQSGGQNPLAVNVFIDGQSQKSQIIDGGVSGQDDSRGNPFPQLAVQEFRVVTQNFKAEYEQSSSAIITAVTRSGGNDFEGEIFGTYQNENWIARTSIDRQNGRRKPDLTRKQYGGLISGPIVQDRLHFLFTYEKKEEDRNAAVVLGRNGYENLFGDLTGNVATPFEEDLYFGKLSWQANDAHRVDLSVTYRDEQDIRDVGGQDALERANALAVTEKKANLRWQWQGASWLNEFQIDYLESNYNPTALNFSETGAEFVVFRDASADPGFQFDVNNRDATIIRTGGRDSNQDITQESITFRNDLTFDEFDWYGGHTIKLGAKFVANNYYVEKEFQRNPFFVYDVDARPEITGSRDIPVRVTVGSPVPAADVDNNVFGLYVQDDWQVTEQLEINVGLRWDYEDNAFNNDYKTPANIVALLNAYRNLPGYNLRFNPDDYISDGSREAFKGAFQPRIGFSYDVFNDERTVIFGGAGRYYDRVPYNFAFDERFKPTQYVREIFFSLDGSRPGTVAWNPSYLTAAGLQPLLDAQPLAGEIFLVQNEAEPPVTDQFNFGLRQRFGAWRTSATLSYAKTSNGFQWNIGNLGPGENDRFNGPTPSSLGFPEFRNLVFISSHDSEREYKALYLTAEKPYTPSSGWGVSVAYTLSEAEQNGSRDNNTAPFDFDYARVSLSPTYPSSSDERHRIVATGIVDLPFDFKLSTLVTLGSGTPFNVFYSDGTPIGWNAGRPAKDDFLFLKDAFAFQQIDLRLTKTFELWNGHEFELIVDAINITNHENYADFEGFFGSNSNPNPGFGIPRTQVLPTRSLQIGARYRW